MVDLHLKLHNTGPTLLCPKCKTGFMVWSGSVLYIQPALYPHTCNNEDCKYHQDLVKEQIQ